MNEWKNLVDPAAVAAVHAASDEDPYNHRPPAASRARAKGHTRAPRHNQPRLLRRGRAKDKTECEIGRCRVCGCTDDQACPGGCYWVDPSLCSRCAEAQSEPGFEQRQSGLYLPTSDE